MLAPPLASMMVSEGQKHKIIQEFLIPDELKDGIAYCQRSLRDCVKVHQDYAERCKSLATNQQTQVKQYLSELEAEMLAIGREQSGLVQDLTRRLKLFQQRTANERRVELGDDLANGYVAWLLSNHCDIQCSFASTPHKVTERLNESQLYQKYRLDPIIKQEPGEDPASLPSETAKPSEKKLRKRPVLQTSLLKPQPECPVVVDDEERKPSLSPPVTPPTPPPLPPPPVVTTKATVDSERAAPTVGSSKRKTIEAPVELKNLRSRSVNGAVAPKAKPMLQPAETVQRASSEEQIPPTDTVPVTAAMKRSRNILHQALNKAKITQKVSPPSSATKTNRGSRGGTAAIEPNQQRGVSVSSDSSNSRSSTPGSSQFLKSNRPVELATVSSDDSSNERFLPLEECCPPPPESIHEWDQYTFLKLYGLYTLEDSKLLKERKNERKRRSCCSTERKEFHYGRYDHFEQQYYVLQSKRRPNGNKRPALLYTSTSAEKCGKKRSGSSWPTVPSTTSSPPPPPPAPPLSPPVPVASDLPPAAIVEPTSAAEDKKLYFLPLVQIG
ncbi:uncharacterized protein LOC128276642 [Anopheles cruzii]|uniref:uncharacterized protein LOC128276642 n=1 Tax=Anopheles cruzii TaxID=68878 RepID=UPI0022EC2111|nr:uncharacterized protein LOC128276642 [Anopheles cruzii]